MSQEVGLDKTIYSVTLDCTNCDTHQSEPTIQCDNCGANLVRGLRDGTVIAGQYEYIETIGAGGMGLIIKGKDKTSNEMVAVKLLLHNNNPTEVRRFQLEAKAASMLSHDHIIRIYDFGTSEDGYPYMAMEYIVGANLSDLIAASGSLDLGEALHIFDQVCEAMSYAHSRGIVHRDIKPSNIMLCGGAQDHVKIVDFGIAKLLDKDAAEKSLTKTGHIVGSPLYMSPEQASGKKIDARTDIYSAGCVLFHALTGAPPIEGGTAMETLLKHLNTIPPTLSEASLGKKFPQSLEEIVAKMMNKEPANRYQSFQELRADLHQASRGLSVGSKDRGAPHAVLPNKAILVVVGIITVALAGVTIGYFLNLKSQIAKKSNAITIPNPEHPRVTAVDHDGGTIPDPASWSEVIINTNISAHKTDFSGLADPSTTDDTLGYLATQLKDHKAQIDTLVLDKKTDITNEGIRRLENLELHKLVLTQTRIDGNALPSIAKIKSLTDLRISGLGSVTPGNLDSLASLTNLQSIEISYCNQLTGSDCKFLKKLHELRSLNLANDLKVNDDLIPQIAGLPKLSRLFVQFTSLDDKGLHQISHLKTLQTLDITGCFHVSDEGLRSLKALPRLFNLDITGLPLTDKNLTALSRLHSLNKVAFFAIDSTQESRLKSVLPPACIVVTEGDRNWDLAH